MFNHCGQPCAYTYIIYKGNFVARVRRIEILRIFALGAGGRRKTLMLITQKHE